MSSEIILSRESLINQSDDIAKSDKMRDSADQDDEASIDIKDNLNEKMMASMKVNEDSNHIFGFKNSFVRKPPISFKMKSPQ